MSPGPFITSLFRLRITRRRFFKLLLGFGLLSRLLPVFARQEPQVQPSVDTLRAYLDVLIPADETPSATQLGVDKQMLTKGRNDQNYQLALVVGTSWLDEQAREQGARDFVSLDAPARETVVARAAASDHESVEKQFFEITRTDAFLYYYARPESWGGLGGFHGPPQPVGYMDYHRPPRK